MDGAVPYRTILQTTYLLRVRGTSERVLLTYFLIFFSLNLRDVYSLRTGVETLPAGDNLKHYWIGTVVLLL
jgi:hypothetical protein